MDREDFQWKNKEHILELEQFQGKKGQGLPLLYFPLLLAHTGVKNCFTTREGGCSTGMFQSLNLSFTRGDGEVGEDITHNIPAFLNVPLTIPHKERLVKRL